jgi:hypothetical protein
MEYIMSDKIGGNEMSDALQHIETAKRALEMIEYFVKSRKLSAHKHVPMYYDVLIKSMGEVQKIVLSDQEYNRRFSKMMEYVSQERVFRHEVIENEATGEVLHRVHALMPVRDMKQRIVV